MQNDLRTDDLALGDWLSFLDRCPRHSYGSTHKKNLPSYPLSFFSISIRPTPPPPWDPKLKPGTLDWGQRLSKGAKHLDARPGIFMS